MSRLCATSAALGGFLCAAGLASVYFEGNGYGYAQAAFGLLIAAVNVWRVGDKAPAG